MGKKIQKKGNWKRLLAMLLIAISIATIINPVDAQANAKSKVKTKTITLKPLTERESYSYVKKKATTIKTGYKYNIKLKQYMALTYGGYVKFKAPKTKTYSFTISNIKQPVKKGDPLGRASFKKAKNYSFYPLKVKTRNKTTDCLNVSKTKYRPPYGNDASVYYPSRTGKVKLKKNQTIYIYFWFDTMTYSKSMSFNFAVK